MVTLAEASREEKQRNNNRRKNGGAKGTTSLGSGKGGREQPTNVPEQTAKGTRRSSWYAASAWRQHAKADLRLRARLCRFEAEAVLPYINFCQSKIDSKTMQK